jgi:type III pantothenate kinase
MNLLIDMGNTRLKWGIYNNLEIIAKPAIPNADINHITLKNLWQAMDKPCYMAISCVSGSRLFDLVISVARELWPGIKIIQEKSKAYGFGITNAYQEPEKLGVDRWLGMVAGFHNYRKALCIVGCGTAITLDIVDATGRHLGGLISPGLRLMREALAKNTENLEANEKAYPFGLAHFTDAAIHNGTLSAACGLIERTLACEPVTTLLLMTGGDAEVIAAHLSKPALIDPELVLRGLALSLHNTP